MYDLDGDGDVTAEEIMEVIGGAGQTGSPPPSTAPVEETKAPAGTTKAAAERHRTPGKTKGNIS